MPGKWPFKPDHISNDWQDHGLTGQGVVSNRHLQGYQTIVCANVENPTTIIEFTPEGRPVRTDSLLQEHPLRPPCKKFRAFTDHTYCRDCDS